MEKNDARATCNVELQRHAHCANDLSTLSGEIRTPQRHPHVLDTPTQLCIAPSYAAHASKMITATLFQTARAVLLSCGIPGAACLNAEAQFRANL